MSAPNISVDLVNAIARHRAAVAADEAMFSDDGKPIHSEAAAEVTLAAEIEAFRPVIEFKCATSADVQYKIDYLLTGDVGERDRLLDRVRFGEEKGVDLTILLRSFSFSPREVLK